jgi:hypothetical protein
MRVSACLVRSVQTLEGIQLNRLRSKLTYANVISTVCLFLLLGGGTAFAASQLGKNSVGANQIKKNAVTTAKLKKGAVTGSKLKLSTLGTVPSATNATNAVNATNAKHASTADSATNANHASSADNATNAAHASSADSVALVHVFKGGAVPAAASVAGAPKIELGAVGPFNFYGKCYEEAGDVNAVEYVELTSGEATLGGEDSDEFSDDGDGYLTPSSPEEDRELKSLDTGANDFNADSSDEEFQASATDGTEITGEASGIGAKSGTPTSGNGPFLPGNSCIIGTIAVFGG